MCALSVVATISAVLREVILATSLVGGCAPSLLANTEIDRFMGAEMALNSVPGLALAIVDRGEIGLVRAYGIQSVESACRFRRKVNSRSD